MTGILLLVSLCAAEKPQPTPLDVYIREALARPSWTVPFTPTAGSLWSATAPLGDLGRDLRSNRVDDLVTILVAERASGTATGNTKTARKTSAKAGISAVAGLSAAKIPQLGDLAGMTGDTTLDGQGATSRETVLTATLAARVTHVLPNGYLVVQGTKDTTVNSERQIVSVRGVVRPADLTPGNFVRSDRLAQLEVRINGKGVVNDSIRRPNFIYRVLLGLLPF